MDALIEKFAEVDETWRTSALELAWLQHFSKTWTSLPEWDYKRPSIIPDNMDVSLLVSSARGPCPLCSQVYVAENTPYGIKKHMKFHTKHSISHDGRIHLICRLPCKPRGHYHCLCGMAIRAKKSAQHHIRTCLNAVSGMTGNDGAHSISHNTSGSSPSESAACSRSGGHHSSPYTSALAHECTDGHDHHRISLSAREEKRLRGKEISKVYRMVRRRILRRNLVMRRSLYMKLRREERRQWRNIRLYWRQNVPRKLHRPSQQRSLSSDPMATTPQHQPLSIDRTAEASSRHHPRGSDPRHIDPSASTLTVATPQQRPLSINPRSNPCSSDPHGNDPPVAAVATPPALRSLLKCSNEDDLQGFVDPAHFTELLTLFCAEINFTNTDFVKFTGKSLSTTDYKSKRHLVKWQAESSHGPKIPYLGMPFMVIQRATYECRHGPLHVTPKQQSRLQIEHSYSGSMSKKVACPAKAYVKKIVIFTDPAFRVEEKSQPRYKVVKNLKAAIARNENLSVSYRVYVKFPGVECHEGHGFDEN